MRYAAIFVALMAVGTGCIGGGATERTILVDYASDEFATFVLHNFPTRIEAHPGDSLVIRQTWTGEPHTFTGGTLYSKVAQEGARWFTFFDAFETLQHAGAPLPDPENAGD